MKCVVFGVSVSDYEIADKKTGQVKSGQTLKFSIVKGRPSVRKGSTGCEASMLSGIPDLIPFVQKAVHDYPLPFVADLDTDIKAGGGGRDGEPVRAATMQVVGFDVLGPMSRYTIDANGLRERTPADVPGNGRVAGSPAVAPLTPARS